MSVKKVLSVLAVVLPGMANAEYNPGQAQLNLINAQNSFNQMIYQLPFHLIAPAARQNEIRNLYANANSQLQYAQQIVWSQPGQARLSAQTAASYYTKVALFLPLSSMPTVQANNLAQQYMSASNLVNAAAEKLEFGSQPPPPPPPPTPIPDPVIQDNNAFYVNGIEARDLATATQTWQSACANLRVKVTSLAAPRRVESINCQQPSNISDNAQYGYTTYGSAVNVRVSVRPGSAVSAEGWAIGSDVNTKTAALESWNAQCMAQLQSLKNYYGPRFQYGSCGYPANVSPNASYRYYQFRSDVKVWLAPY